MRRAARPLLYGSNIMKTLATITDQLHLVIGGADKALPPDATGLPGLPDGQAYGVVFTEDEKNTPRMSMATCIQNPQNENEFKCTLNGASAPYPRGAFGAFMPKKK